MDLRDPMSARETTHRCNRPLQTVATVANTHNQLFSNAQGCNGDRCIHIVVAIPSPLGEGVATMQPAMSQNPVVMENVCEPPRTCPPGVADLDPIDGLAATLARIPQGVN